MLIQRSSGKTSDYCFEDRRGLLRQDPAWTQIAEGEVNFASGITNTAPEIENAATGDVGLTLFEAFIRPKSQRNALVLSSAKKLNNVSLTVIIEHIQLPKAYLETSSL